MKKIMLVFHGTNFSEGAFEFANTLNKLQPIVLTAAFIPTVELENSWDYPLAGDARPSMAGRDEELASTIIARFKERCLKNNIKYTLHKKNYGLFLPSLKKESKYTDLIIFGSQAFYEDIGTGNINTYLKNALHNIACPVLVVPEKFDFPESIILAYDGTGPSVYAIKQFSYLFPELCNKEALIVYASIDKKDNFADKSQLEELADCHFNDLAFFKLHTVPERYFYEWLSKKKSSILVSGAHGSSSILRMFRRSFVEEVISKYRLPVFIAHK